MVAGGGGQQQFATQTLRVHLLGIGLLFVGGSLVGGQGFTSDGLRCPPKHSGTGVVRGQYFTIGGYFGWRTAVERVVPSSHVAELRG